MISGTSPSSLTLFLGIFCITGYICFAQDLTLVASTTAGVDLDSPGSIVEGSLVKIKCAFPTRQTAGYVGITMSIRMNEEDNWIPQVLCSQRSDGTIHIINHASSSGIFTSENTTCDNNNMIVTLNDMRESYPKYYECSRTPEGKAIQERYIVLRSHTLPVEPAISQIPAIAPVEGSTIAYSCTSRGRPPPKLYFSYGEQRIPDSELEHKPSDNSTSVDSPESTTLLTWTTDASRIMNGESLRCKIRDHPSKSEKSVTHEMSVFYGPENKTDQAEEWNLYVSEARTLVCDLESNGGVSYEWYMESVEDSNKLTDSSRNISLDGGSFTKVVGNHEETKVYICKLTNRDVGDKVAYLQISLRIYRAPVTTTSTTKLTTTTTLVSENITKSADGGSTSLVSATLIPLHIGLIATGTVIFVIVIVITALVCRSRQNSPAAQKKKQASNKKSGGNVNLNSDAGQTPQTDIRNSYRGNDSTLPLDYRSSYSQPVEDYADAIDDKPRSRKPIAYSMDELNDLNDGPPSFDGGPPAYHPHPDSTLYRDYDNMATIPRDYYGKNYGAAC